MSTTGSLCNLFMIGNEPKYAVHLPREYNIINPELSHDKMLHFGDYLYIYIILT